MQGVRQSYTVLRNVRLNIGAKHTSTSVKDVDSISLKELLVGGPVRSGYHLIPDT